MDGKKERDEQQPDQSADDGVAKDPGDKDLSAVDAALAGVSSEMDAAGNADSQAVPPDQADEIQADEDQASEEQAPGDQGGEPADQPPASTAANLDASTAPNSVVDPAEEVPQRQASTAGDQQESSADDGDTDAATATTEESSSAEETDGETSDAEVESATGDAPADQPQVEPVSQQDLDEARQKLAEQLLGERRLSESKIDELVAEFAGLIERSESDAASEFATFADLVETSNAATSEEENRQKETTLQTLTRFRDAIDVLYTAIPAVAESVSSAIEVRSDEQLESLDDQLRQSLANYRQGLEIIGRMFNRCLDRKPELVPMDVLFGQLEAEQPEVTAVEEFSTALEQLVGQYHDIRDKNYHLLREARSDCEKQIKKAMNGLKQVLSAMDGIDNGLLNENESQSGTAEQIAELEESVQEKVASWYGAYQPLAKALDELVANTELAPIEIHIGHAFDPETMEPQGVVEDPEMEDDDVAVVLRRGFSFCGQLVRPALVEVVKNS